MWQADCSINGTLPALSNLTNLAEFSVSSNQLTGTIPLDWASSFRLEAMELDNNRLHGTLPPPSTGNLYGVHRALPALAPAGQAALAASPVHGLPAPGLGAALTSCILVQAMKPDRCG